MEADNLFPEKDSPWTLYFNGEAMPRWANQWCMLPLLVRAEVVMRDWDEPVGFFELWRLHCRIDHLGIVESEDPDTFQVCCLTLALLTLRHRDAFLEHIAATRHDERATPGEIFAGIRDGLFAMAQRSAVDGIAFWTSGYEADRAHLCDTIRRHRLPQTDPQWLEAPHVQKNRTEAQHRINILREQILSLDSSSNLQEFGSNQGDDSAMR